MWQRQDVSSFLTFSLLRATASRAALCVRRWREFSFAGDSNDVRRTTNMTFLRREWTIGKMLRRTMLRCDIVKTAHSTLATQIHEIHIDLSLFIAYDRSRWRDACDDVEKRRSSCYLLSVARKPVCSIEQIRRGIAWTRNQRRREWRDREKRRRRRRRKIRRKRRVGKFVTFLYRQRSCYISIHQILKVRNGVSKCFHSPYLFFFYFHFSPFLFLDRLERERERV